MNDRDSARIKKIIEDQDGNLVIAITKYRWAESLCHSGYGIVFLICIVVALALAVMELWIGAVMPLLVSLFFWVRAWLDANDRLKGRIYPELLEKHLLENGLQKEPFILKRFYPYVDSIRCICDDGTEKEYKVVFIQEQLPMYVVKIHMAKVE